MSEFYRTRTGQQFYEVTMPRLVRELARLNTNLERLADVARPEARAEGESPGTARPLPARSP